MADDIHAWLAELQKGDSAAAQKIWERYFDQLVRLAQRRMGGLPRRAADEEDIALSAMNSFVTGAGPAGSRSWTTRAICGGCWLRLLPERPAPSGGVISPCGAIVAKFAANRYFRVPRMSPPILAASALPRGMSRLRNLLPKWPTNARPCSRSSTIPCSATLPPGKWKG